MTKSKVASGNGNMSSLAQIFLIGNGAESEDSEEDEVAAGIELDTPSSSSTELRSNSGAYSTAVTLLMPATSCSSLSCGHR